MRRRACLESNVGLLSEVPSDDDGNTKALLLYLFLKPLNEDDVIALELLTPANGFPPTAIELLLP